MLVYFSPFKHSPQHNIRPINLRTFDIEFTVYTPITTTISRYLYFTEYYNIHCLLFRHVRIFQECFHLVNIVYRIRYNIFVWKKIKYFPQYYISGKIFRESNKRQLADIETVDIFQTRW